MKLQIAKEKIIILFLVLFTPTFISCNKQPQQDKTKTKNTDSQKIEAVKPNDNQNQTKQATTAATNSLGKRLFILCASCHNVKQGEPHKVGPNLYGIFGKKAGLTEGFAFSEELTNKDIVWNEETIRLWIENPAEYVPGTKMAFVGVKKKAQQDALIAYLKDVTKE